MGIGKRARIEEIAIAGFATLAAVLVLTEPAHAQALRSDASTFLGGAVWREASGGSGSCNGGTSFQRFSFEPKATVEVGQGAPGAGETLELHAARLKDGMVELESGACGPTGCNRTFEQYKVLDRNRIQEWRFEGRLPGEEPLVLVDKGRASDGAPGRVFARCPA
jgi:hypothetical protein